MELRVQILEEIEKLPVLPESLIKLRKMQNDPNRDNKVLAQVIEEYPMIVTNLLKITKSPIYGFKNNITNVLQVITLFGANSVINMVIFDMIKNSFTINLSPYEITTEDFSRTSSIRSFLIEKLVSDENPELKEKMKFAAFVLDIGKLIYSNIMIKNHGYSDFIKLKKEKDIINAEKEVFKYSSEEITAVVLKKWNFDLETIALIKNINTPSSSPVSLINETLLLNSIKSLVGYKIPFDDEVQENFVNEVMKHQNIEEKRIKKILEKMEDKFLDEY